MDYFNEDEREHQKEFAERRDRFFDPVVKVLERLSISPNHVTFIGVLFLIIGCSFGPEAPWVPSVFLFLYCVMDGIDGPLARRLGKDSKAGALLDIIADQLGVVFVPAAAVYHLGTNGVAATLFASFYVSFIVIVVYANQNEVKIPKFFRIKYVMYFFYCFFVILNMDYMTHFFGLFSVCYMIMFAVIVYHLYRHMLENP